MPYSAPRTAAPAGSRPRWWTELPLVILVYACYSAGRLLARGNVSTAVDHGLAILHVEKTLRINFEHPLNRLFTREPWIGIPADFAYASLHYLVTPAILIWLYRRRPAHYRAARTWLLLSTFLGLIGFTLLPTCPPRLLAAGYGFVDTMAQYSSYGWWGKEASAPRGMGGMTNQYAAMPSLHVGWALWCGVLLWRHGRSRLVRRLGIAYPTVTVIVVMGTANHYFLDAVAGCAVMGLGYLLSRPLGRLAERVRTRLGLLPGLAALRSRATRMRTRASTGAVVSTGAVASTGAVGSHGTPASTAVSAPIVSAGCKTSTGEPNLRQPAPGDPFPDAAPIGPDEPRRDRSDTRDATDAPAPTSGSAAGATR